MRSSDYGSFDFGPMLSSVSIDDLVKSLRVQFELSLMNEPIYIGDLAVRLAKTTTGNSGFRYWFVCPNCATRVGKLFLSGKTAACRHCAAVKYPSSRYKGMVESESLEGLSGD